MPLSALWDFPPLSRTGPQRGSEIPPLLQTLSPKSYSQWGALSWPPSLKRPPSLTGPWIPCPCFLPLFFSSIALSTRCLPDPSLTSYPSPISLCPMAIPLPGQISDMWSVPGNLCWTNERILVYHLGPSLWLRQDLNCGPSFLFWHLLSDQMNPWEWCHSISCWHLWLFSITDWMLWHYHRW